MAKLSPSTEESGLSLVLRLQAGTDEAWSQLVTLYGPLVASWCRRAGLATEDQADVAQAVFLAVHRSIRRFDPEHPRATFRGWLWTITRHAIAAHWRQASAPGQGGSTHLKWLEHLSGAADELDEEDPSTVMDTTQLLRRAMAQVEPQVEPKSWQAFWRTAVLGGNATEVATELGLSPAAVRQAKSRVLRRLRQQLGDRP